MTQLRRLSDDFLDWLEVCAEGLLSDGLTDADVGQAAGGGIRCWRQGHDDSLAV